MGGKGTGSLQVLLKPFSLRHRDASNSLGSGRSLFFTSYKALPGGVRIILEHPCKIVSLRKDNATRKVIGHLSCSQRWEVKAANFVGFTVYSSKTSLAGPYAVNDSSFCKSIIIKSRKLWTSMPTQMGRRSSKIATRKTAQDAKKAKAYGKIGKEIVSAVKRGGSPNPVANPALATLLQYAKNFDIPKEIIERNIKKASEKGQQDYVEVTYEAYGYGGVGIVVEVLTDNLNRAAANIRDVVKKSGCKMADPGSVLFNFRRAGVINVRADKVDGDSLLAAAMDAGAEDVIEPTHEQNEDVEDTTFKYFRVITSFDQYSVMVKRLQDSGILVDVECSGLELIPTTTFEPDDEALEVNKTLMEKLLELDDVDAVYCNQI